MRIEIIKGDSGTPTVNDWFFRFVMDNGQEMARSKAFKQWRSAFNAIKTVLKSSPIPVYKLGGHLLTLRRPPVFSMHNVRRPGPRHKART